MDAEFLGKKLAKLRKDSKMTQTDLANKLNVSNKTISKWEKGYSVPDIVTIQKISKVFDIPINSLIDETSKLNTKKHNFKTYFKIVGNFIKKNIIKIIFIIAFIFLLIYFINNYNSIKVYNIKSDDTAIIFDGGNMIESNIKTVIIINDIQIVNMDYTPITIKVNLYTFVNGDKVVFYESDELGNIKIYKQSNYEEKLNKSVIEGIKKGMFLSVDIIDNKDVVHNYEIKLDVIKDFANDKLFYFSKKDPVHKEANRKSDYSFSEVILLNNGFEKNEKMNTFIKDSKNLNIIIDLDLNKITISKFDKSNTNIYDFNYNKKYLKFTIYDKNKKMIKNYDYYDNENILKCYVGDCSNYLDDIDYVIGILDSIK